MGTAVVKGNASPATPTSSPSSEDGSGGRIQDMCVLLVEDENVARKCAEMALRSCGYRVLTAENGKQALDLLKSPKGDEVDLILTDILMPEVSGLQLLENVVQTPKWKQLPVTVMSTQDSIDTAANCIQKGAVEFLAKPVRKHKLANLWQHVLRRKSHTESGSGSGSGTTEISQLSGDDATKQVASGPHASNGGIAQQANGSPVRPLNGPSLASLRRDVTASAAGPLTASDLKTQFASALPTWANQLPQAIVEIAFRPSDGIHPVAGLVPQNNGVVRPLPHSNSCSAFSAFMRCREPQFDANVGPSSSGQAHSSMQAFPALGAMPQVLSSHHPLQVSNLHIVQHGGKGAFRGSGMLTTSMLQDLIDTSAKAANGANGANGAGVAGQSPNAHAHAGTNGAGVERASGATDEAHHRRALAIKKFREKKKARTFKKKVRYESRKRLAQQRPRIKGQFVRPEVAAAAAAAAAAGAAAAAAGAVVAATTGVAAAKH